MTSDRQNQSPVLVLRDVLIVVGARTVLKSINLSLYPGEFVALLGPNGVGKTTLLKAVLGLLPLHSGEVRVLGLPPAQAGPKLGYLPQGRSFDASVRVRGVDLVRLGLDGPRWGFSLPGFLGGGGRGAKERVKAVIDLVGAAAYAERPIGELSGGEQQRLLIAQAVVHRPALLLLDEPLTSLDLPNQAEMTALVGRLSHEEGIAVLMVTHDVNPVLSYLDRVVYLASDRALAGTPQEVISGASLSHLYGTPIEVHRTQDGRLLVIGQQAGLAIPGDGYECEVRDDLV